MANDIKVAAYEGGDLKSLRGDKSSSHEVVLALNADRLLIKMVRIPHDVLENSEEYVKAALVALSPYPDEPLTIGMETVRETEAGKVVLAAALPESAADDIAEALDAAKLNVTRIDSLALGTLRAIWPKIPGSGRKLVLIRGIDKFTLIVLDGDQPSAFRAIDAACDLKREIMLSLIEAEEFGGEYDLEKIYVVSSAAVMGEAEVDESELSKFASVEKIALADEDAALKGVKERSMEEGSLNALPESWHEVLEETRFKSKMKKYLMFFGFIWALLMVAIFATPMVFDKMTQNQKDLMKKHRRAHQEVLTMREKVNVVRKYSDHDRGALEIMKAVSDRLPKEIELNSWSFIREDDSRKDAGLKISGESLSTQAIYVFKDNIDAMNVFTEVVLNGPSDAKGGKSRFDLQCMFGGGEE